MLVINYKNNTPQQKYYAVGVKQNNNANKIKFVLKANQDGIDLQNLTPYLKLQNKEHTYLDKIELETIYKSANGIIEITWLMTRKSMEYRYLEAQLVFEDNEEDIVWQTLIVELELNETIDADEEISEATPTILQQLQGEVKDIASMRDVLKNIKYEYDEEHDTSRLTMPRGILPLRIVNNPNRDIYYFDYGTKKIIEENGNNQVGVIHIWDSVVYLDFYYDVAWEYHESEHEQYAIDYAGLDGDECKLNTYLIYNFPTPEDKTEVLSKITFNYDEDNDTTAITFPKNVAPLIYCNEDYDSNLIFDYYGGRVVIEGNYNEGVGWIDYVNGCVIAYLSGTELTHTTPNDDVIFSYFNNNPEVLNVSNLVKSNVHYGEILSLSTFKQYLKCGGLCVRTNISTGGVYVKKTSNVSFREFLINSTYLDRNSTYIFDGMFIPRYVFISLNYMNNFINQVNGNGGKAYYYDNGSDELEHLGGSYFNFLISENQKYIPLQKLKVEGIYKHTIYFYDTSGDVRIELINNNPFPYLNENQLKELPKGNMTFLRGFCYNGAGGNVDVLLAEISTTANQITCMGNIISNNQGNWTTEVFYFSDFQKDVVEKFDIL